MRFVGIMLICLFVWWGAQCVYFRTHLSGVQKDALAMLPNRPREGYEKIKPVFDYSNAVSLGKANQARDAFFDTLRDQAIKSIKHPPLDPNWFGLMVEDLKVLKDAEKEQKFPLEKHRAAIIAAAVEGESKFKQTLSIDAWDAYVRQIGLAQEADLIPTSAVRDLPGFVDGLKKADRRAIGFRDATDFANEKLAEGVRSLGKEPADILASPDAPLVALLDQKVSTDKFIEAEHAFGSGVNALRRFTKMFSVAPATLPELDFALAKSLYNEAAIKAAHIQIEGFEKLSGEGSGYIVRLLVSPNSKEEPPSSSQLFGAFLQGCVGQLDESVKLLEALAMSGKAPKETRSVLTAAYRTQMLLGQASHQAQLAQAGQGRLQNIRNSASADPSISKVLTTLETSTAVPILVR